MTSEAGILGQLLRRSDGEAMYRLIEDLYPVCRSITGAGVRATLEHIGSILPLDVHEVPSGTSVFDWTVPREWNVREAWIRDPDGNTVVDFADHNLHLVSYSVPVRERMDLAALRPRLHSLPEHPDWIPYRTSYYREDWGFCLSHRQLEGLKEGVYDVCVDTTLEDGSLTYGEALIPGASEDEVLLSAHVCHPSLANDNLSGIALLAMLGAALRETSPNLSYRLIFAPGTIGSIVWLARNQDVVPRIRHGLVVSCVGDAGGPTYKRSRQGDALIDRAMTHVLSTESSGSRIEEFSPYGYDERQYCSPGFDLAVGLFERSKYGAFPQYHTSADNLEFIAPEHLAASYDLVARAIDILERDRIVINTQPHCEPQLGRRGLYEALGGDSQRATRQMAMLWVLNLADGEHSLLQMAERSGLPFALIRDTAELLESHELLRSP